MAQVIELIFTGMGTVFFMLIMVVLLGNLIIRLTNKYAPVVDVQTVSDTKPSEINSAKIAAIVSAIDIVTGGKGRVKSIEKVY